MARPRKTVPDLYLDTSTGRWAANFGGERRRYSRDRAESLAAYKADCAAHLTGRATTPPPQGRPSRTEAALSVAEAVLAYERYARDYYAPEGCQLPRVVAALDAVVEVCGRKAAADFGPLALLSVRDHLLARPGRRPGTARLSRTYVNHLIGCVKTAFTWLASRELVPAEQAAALRLVPNLRLGKGGREVEDIPPVPAWAVEATLPHCHPVLAAMIRVGFLTGMRPGEVCRLRRCDLSTRPDEWLAVPHTRPVQRVAAVAASNGAMIWCYVPPRHKTLERGKRRLVPVGPAAQAALAPFLAGRDPDACLFSPREATDAWLASHGRSPRRGKARLPGERYTTQSYDRAVAKAIRRANRALLKSGPCRPEDLIPDWRPNQLRKAAATLSDEEADRDTTAALLGHSTPDMASEYAARAFRRAAEFAARHG
jgi:integrase